MGSINSRTKSPLFRPAVRRIFRADWAALAFIFLLHATIRFYRLGDVRFIALSMVIIWPSPWLLLSRTGRRIIGLRWPVKRQWFLLAPVVGLLTVVLNAGVVWLLVGSGRNNWFVSYAQTAAQSASRLPPGAPVWLAFLVVALPAATFSPFAEEILYRGLIMSGVSREWTGRAGMTAQATAFSLVHLAHYGLAPWQPVLILLWLPSMFAVALTFGGIVRASRSLWPAMLAHSAYNLGMTVIAFMLFT